MKNLKRLSKNALCCIGVVILLILTACKSEIDKQSDTPLELTLNQTQGYVKSSAYWAYDESEAYIIE